MRTLALYWLSEPIYIQPHLTHARCNLVTITKLSMSRAVTFTLNNTRALVVKLSLSDLADEETIFVMEENKTQ